MSITPSALSFESAHVHAVYEEIAADFSRTRHTRWPFVERFLDSLEPGSLVLDAGTGNGKYLGCRSVLRWEGKDAEGSGRQSGGKGKGKGKATHDERAEEAKRVPVGDMLPIGFDMSSGLLGIAKGKGHEVVRGDCVDLRCWRRGAFDHAISIATIHHFATHARRIEAVKQMILSVLPSSPPSTFDPPYRVSKLLIVVWSLEQDPTIFGGDRSARRTTGGKKGAVPVAGPDGEEEDEFEEKGRDVFVPWERQEAKQKTEKAPKKRARRKPGAEGEGESSTAATTEPSSTDSTPAAPAPAPAPATFNRYYHLFRHRELTKLVMQASNALSLGWEVYGEWFFPIELAARPPDAQKAVEEKEGWDAFVRIVEERWERENWVVEVEVGWRPEWMVPQ
ncbi:tRNA methyltransferase, has a role in tRNA modification [Rhodotorula toruloides]